ncbi:hypothetical protein DBP19_35070 [Streptomyces sp. CS090A]|uniref:hypothetical protein n=1 Tax=Streptomyces sp. CS090A TaxID=2162710 RepID=UPI000D5077B1|nr:hypothetical protein [Streptomyces sp. CS090A]PVC80730.1 hypothetical protein DBP19_35070 [Streptomyces sp. CS090A]
MSVDTAGNPSARRRERQTGKRRSNRFYVTFDDAELEVVRTAAQRGGMAPSAWAGIQLMAVAQEVLVPVSRDAGDVLRELVQARVRLRETVSALRALTDPAPTAPTPNLPTPGAAPDLTEAVRSALEQTLLTVSRIDEATVQIMRERLPRS